MRNGDIFTVGKIAFSSLVFEAQGVVLVTVELLDGSVGDLVQEKSEICENLSITAPCVKHSRSNLGKDLEAMQRKNEK